ncbi:MAG: hypothetical protein U0326_03405 [Polyangiales bacterium]
MSLRAASYLYARTLTPGRRLQMATVYLHDRRLCAALAARVARLALDYVTAEREVLERAIDVTAWWAGGDADLEGLDAARRHAATAAARAAAEDDRCAWTCLQAALALSDVAVEPMIDLAAKRARDLVGYVLDAMCWPDVGDEALRARLEATLHDDLDERFDETPTKWSARP